MVELQLIVVLIIGCFGNTLGQTCQCQSLETCICNAESQWVQLRTTCSNSPTCLQSLNAGNVNSQAVQTCMNQAVGSKTQMSQQMRQCLYTSGGNVCTGTATVCNQAGSGLVAPPLPPGANPNPFGGRKKRHIMGGFDAFMFGQYSQPFANYQQCVAQCVYNNGTATPVTTTTGRKKRGWGGFGGFGGGQGGFGGFGGFGGPSFSNIGTCLSQAGCNSYPPFGSFGTAQQNCFTQSNTQYQSSFLQQCNCLVGALGLTANQVNCTASSQGGYGPFESFGGPFGGPGGFGSGGFGPSGFSRFG